MNLWHQKLTEPQERFTGRRGRVQDRPGRARWVPRGDAGMTTVEYALGTLAAAAFALLLMRVVSSDRVGELVTAVIERALSQSF